MGWTKPWLIAFLVLPAVGCGKSEAKKQEEVRSCSTISLDAQGTADCLVKLYKWNGTEALATAQRRQLELDSLASWRRDSLWRADSLKHRHDIGQCNTGSMKASTMKDCLQLTFGWEEKKAVATADSMWRHDAPRHREEISACSRQRKSSTGSCLMLYYKWPSERALALDDSIRRAAALKQK